MKTKVGMISLGCPKNQVDAEIMLKKLQNSGFEITNDETQAEILIINTCGFIESAQKEAIDTIFESLELKETANVKKIIVTGCLAERYQHEVMKEIPEVDAVIGIGANADIVQVCENVLKGYKYESFPSKDKLPLDCERLVSTPKHWAYLKVSDGCNNCCSYCAIPEIRGRMRSRKIESIVDEARLLSKNGARELIIVAQDTTRYGEDLYGKPMLCELLRKLCEIDDISGLRLMYCYPEMISDELLELIASEDKILNYIDIPIQHSNEKILSAMNRCGSYDELMTLINKMRTIIPDICIRTTIMVGFPGEGEVEFEELARFVKEAKLDKLGCFAFSPQEGTEAYSMPEQVDEDVKQRRLEIVMQEQCFISEENNRGKLGKVYDAVVDFYNSESGLYSARSYFDAPEIDSCIVFESDKKLFTGSLVKLEIIGYDDYDLKGRLI